MDSQTDLLYCIISHDDNTQVIDRSKIRCERMKASDNLNVGEVQVKALYFDGEKDLTLQFANNKRTIVMEEYISLIQEAGGGYLGLHSS